MLASLPRAGVQNPVRVWHNDGAMTRERRPASLLDAASLERLALRYVERFATTRHKLADYLDRKIRTRGWEGAPVDSAAIAERMAELGYIDDRAFAEARATAMTRRGYGARRISGALRQAGIGEEDRESVTPTIEAAAVDSALAYARRRGIGPFAEEIADRNGRERQIAAMIRGGHGFALARRIAAMQPGEDAASLSVE